MGKYNLMIRLIDVVFILLFGFIAISQIGISAAIDPAKSTEADQSGTDAPIEIIIGVSSDGSYPVEAGNRVLRDIRELRAYLSQKLAEAAAQGVPMGVRIRAAWDSSVDHSLAVARLCRELGIPKGLDVIKMKMD